MGLSAHVYQISAVAYSSALRGDIEGFSAGCEVENVLDIDKAWHAIHYLITGDRELRFLVSGIPILPPHSDTFEAHSPQSITALNKRLTVTSVEALMAKFDPAVFEALSIYPEGWDWSAADYIRENLSKFVARVRQVAERGKGIAVMIC